MGDSSLAEIQASYQTDIERSHTLVEALPYIQGFRGKTVVIKYGGSAMEEPELIDLVLRDIVFLEAVGINPVIVHGGGKAITRKMKEKGTKAVFAAGLRVTDAETIEIVDDVLNHEINPAIVQGLIKFGGKAESISGREVFRAIKAPSVHTENGSVDLGFVGEVDRSDIAKVKSMVSREIVPVISPVGDDGKGQPYNLNADVAAAETAIELKAFKLIFISDVNGLLSDEKNPKSTIPTIDSKGIAELKSKGIIRGGMLPKMDSCVKALQEGVHQIHLIDGRIPHSLLLELFTDRGIGTEITL